MARLLSYSQVRKFIHCPYEWHLAHEEGWRAREKSEELVLGSAIHKGISRWLNKAKGPALVSADVDDIEDAGARFHNLQMAKNMLVTFGMQFGPMEEEKRFYPVAVEQHLRRDDFHGYVDCVADVGDHRIVIDWKTTKYPYADWKAHVDDQLTAYAWLMGACRFDEVAFVTLQKPHGKVEWHRSTRGRAQMDDFAQKVEWVRTQMDGGVRHRNPGNCGWCSFVGHCAFGEDLGVRNEQDDF